MRPLKPWNENGSGAGSGKREVGSAERAMKSRWRYWLLVICCSLGPGLITNSALLITAVGIVEILIRLVVAVVIVRLPSVVSFPSWGDLSRLELPAEIRVVTAQQFEERSGWLSTIERVVREKGRLLYERTESVRPELLD
jgi:hypothetical protein